MSQLGSPKSQSRPASVGAPRGGPATRSARRVETRKKLRVSYSHPFCPEHCLSSEASDKDAGEARFQFLPGKGYERCWEAWGA